MSDDEFASAYNNMITWGRCCLWFAFRGLSPFGIGRSVVWKQLMLVLSPQFWAAHFVNQICRQIVDRHLYAMLVRLVPASIWWVTVIWGNFGNMWMTICKSDGLITSLLEASVVVGCWYQGLAWMSNRMVCWHHYLWSYIHGHLTQPSSRPLTAIQLLYLAHHMNHYNN